MSLVEQMAEADERGLAASGLACLDRCLPLLGDSGAPDDALRPLWARLEHGEDWSEQLAEVRATLAPSGAPAAADAEDEPSALTRRMLDAVPERRSPDALRGWADACSVAALQIHRLLGTAADDEVPSEKLRQGITESAGPLVAGELRRQTEILELLATRGAGGLRQALEVSTEGRRVLRAVVSRRARGGQA
ncbi:hypothetical protein [Streptomyces apocyni]|uniref:hypothetical protein n=1 Tax=Streptomyces apocyni TaxID=2654677 RepID=UPI0012EAA1AC|nr:hypothetical protein [Streptomyces apocyni]